MSTMLHAFDLLAPNFKLEVAPAIVLFGDDSFLKSRTLNVVRDSLVGGGDSDMSVMQFDGNETLWRDVVDELSTISLFGSSGPRVVIVKDADKMITASRAAIEDYLAKPCRNSSLVLTVSAWLKTTKLYKAVEKMGQAVECRAPQATRGRSVDQRRVVEWIQSWAKQSHSLQIESLAAQQLIDLVGFEFGIIDQSLAKLSLFADDSGKLEQDAVKEIVGGWQAKTTWDMIDAAAAGDCANAIKQLHRLLQSGKHAMELYGQISWSLRRYAAAAEIFYRGKRDKAGIGFDASLEKAGFRKFPAGSFTAAQANMKQIGRDRLDQLYQWLIETDLELKGSHSNPTRSRYSLEKLIFRLAKTAS